MPKVSIIIPAYNSAHFLPDAIESALAQTFSDYEIIIVDDGSSDNTAQVVRPYTEKYAAKIRYLWQENQGVSTARNKGIDNSHGEYLALLDADDQWFPNRLEEGVRILDTDPSVGLVHANITRIDVEGKELETPKRYPKLLNGHIFENIFLRKAHLACPTILFRRSCFDDVGAFDLRLSKLGCEDRDLWLRISQKYKICYIDKVLAYYRISAQSMIKNAQNMMEARLYVIDKYCPSNDPGKRDLRRKALAKIFRDSGDLFLMREDFINARQEYVQAITHDTLAFWPWINLIKATLRIRTNKSYVH